MANLKAAREVIENLERIWSPEGMASLTAIFTAYDSEEQEETYAVGDRFECCGEGVYIIAAVEHNVVSLINISNGSRAKDPTRVADWDNITEGEFAALLGPGFYPQDFKRVEKET